MVSRLLRHKGSNSFVRVIVFTVFCHIFVTINAEVPCDSTDERKADPCMNTESVELVLDPTDCSLYYQCIEGSGFSIPCPDGFHFNAKAKSCESPSTAGCACTTETDEGSEKEDPEADCPPTEAPASCGNVPHGDLSPDETDCRFFYQCVRGENVRLPCPSGLYYNAKKKWCDWPEESGCDFNGNVTSKPPIVTDAPGVTNEPEGTDCPPTEPPAKCGDIEHGDLSPDETDCGYYYQCVHGKNIRMKCPPGLYYNAKLKWCDWPEESGCEFNGNVTSKPPIVTDAPGVTSEPEGTDSPPTEPPAKCGNVEHGDLSPDETDCSYYYQCVHGKNIRMKCPAGLYYNAKLKWCDWPEESGCDFNGNVTSKPPVVTDAPGVTNEPEGTDYPPTEPPAKCGDIEHGDLSPDKTDCGYYYQCVHGKNIRMKCPAGLHYNAKLKWCDWPDEAGCDPSISTKPPGTSTTESNCGESGSTECPTTEVPTKCGDVNHGDLSKDPESCEYFYQCSYGKNVRIPCPKGLHFNAALKICDWPLQAGCDSSIVTKPPGGGCTGSKEGSCP